MNGRNSEGALTDEAAGGRLPHDGTINVFPAVHQCEKRAKNAGFDFVGHRIAAGGSVYQRPAARHDFLHEFVVAFVAVFPERRFAAHFSALLLDEKREMEDTHVLGGKSRRHSNLAAFGTTNFRHWHTRSEASVF